MPTSPLAKETVLEQKKKAIHAVTIKFKKPHGREKSKEEEGKGKAREEKEKGEPASGQGGWWEGARAQAGYRFERVGVGRASWAVAAQTSKPSNLLLPTFPPSSSSFPQISNSDSGSGSGSSSPFIQRQQQISRAHGA
jgi:hypothetical protein